MDKSEKLYEHIKNQPDFNSKESPLGYCPNCWGRQEYGGKFYEQVKEVNIDINAPNPAIGWVQEYSAKYLRPIKLKKQGSGLSCGNCKLTYDFKDE